MEAFGLNVLASLVASLIGGAIKAAAGLSGSTYRQGCGYYLIVAIQTAAYFLIMVIITPLLLSIVYPVFARTSFLQPFAGLILIVGWVFLALLFFFAIFFGWNK